MNKYFFQNSKTGKKFFLILISPCNLIRRKIDVQHDSFLEKFFLQLPNKIVQSQLKGEIVRDDTGFSIFFQSLDGNVGSLASYYLLT